MPLHKLCFYSSLIRFLVAIATFKFSFTYNGKLEKKNCPCYLIGDTLFVFEFCFCRNVYKVILHVTYDISSKSIDFIGLYLAIKFTLNNRCKLR